MVARSPGRRCRRSGHATRGHPDRGAAESAPPGVRRADADRLDDVIRACEATRRYIGDERVRADLVHDAVRMRLIEIGEADRVLPAGVTASEPGIPWSPTWGSG